MDLLPTVVNDLLHKLPTRRRREEHTEDKDRLNPHEGPRRIHRQMQTLVVEEGEVLVLDRREHREDPVRREEY